MSTSVKSPGAQCCALLYFVPQNKIVDPYFMIKIVGLPLPTMKSKTSTYKYRITRFLAHTVLSGNIS